ncbi:hypothetical protein UWK_03286 [Desulfocapsa sulfexigens DSM 10523]|uniref:Uncharacterized protein n=1 Tax=Desulfocapsa sulfexigens (strain DSM 10523 / SB164P1) TaxID=1167006 RepID=M1P8K0_DESSD|nr:hypothetical protein [Desulfocapsa sulfexigens]AGF79813.1 hypothetical protein UWK_03286 [Desulfocapsa sulfexigens DSM 10523]
MKKIFLRSSLFFLLLGTFLLSCPFVMASENSVMDRINAAEEPFNNMKIETAYELPVKTVRAKESYQGGTFRVLARKDSITKFRCSVCHTEKNVLIRDGALFTHSDIEINHGRGGDKLSCIECHDENDRDSLSDAEGKKIDFDHSYQLCGQCHFRQKRDWLGGAHGKREAYWAGERVVRNCTSCHSPHSPAFEKKMPVTYSLPLDK